MPADLSGMIDQFRAALGGGGGAGAGSPGGAGGAGGGGTAIVVGPHQPDFQSVIEWWSAMAWYPEERSMLRAVVRLPEDVPAKLKPSEPEPGCTSLLPAARLVRRRR